MIIERTPMQLALAILLRAHNELIAETYARDFWRDKERVLETITASNYLVDAMDHVHGQ